ncbi:copper-binding protein [Bosea lathyri]|uniref:Cu and Ag efflux protein CusF n=1 Tax=Bosea lathyri TaxID=1036778 RepID=A0A1H5Y834_9HYPH|nr:copper-binding protein [Bosea lathyri]SEG20108.1 Cu and Ag efflux protein CusF [Bosea lathyri]
MRRILTFFALTAVLAGPTLAQDAPLVSATVKKIDIEQGKITLDHGPIKNLDMDGMTMVFKAADPTMLKTVKAGDKVKFTADRVNGQITVTKLQK